MLSGVPAAPTPEKKSRFAEPARAWVVRWLPLAPILVAEAVLWVGFGAVLPVLPLYAQSSGVSVAAFGLIAAALPAARLVAEPVFGVLADHVPRRPLLVGALLLTIVAAVLPLIAPTVALLLLSRAVTGFASAMFDPAARGLIVEMTPENARGEAFGLYGSAQMGGLLFGPAIGALGAAAMGGLTFPFVLAAVTGACSAVYLAVALRGTSPMATAAARRPPRGPAVVGATIGPPAAPADPPPRAPLRAVANRLVVAALVMHAAMYFSVGVYEVIWSLYLERLGGSLAWIGFTFTLFGIPVLLLSPFAGRLVDRFGPLRFAVLGGLGIAAAGIAYTLATDAVVPGWICTFEGVAEAFIYPALFALVAAGTPAGRASTVQGLYGASGTLAFIVSSLLAGVLFTVDPRYPFYVFTAVILAGMGAGYLIARGAVADRWGAARTPAAQSIEPSPPI
jgi:MFS transporter, DHA1 family, multidrug resistance protein